jgi:hypothetical protein
VLSSDRTRGGPPNVDQTPLVVAASLRFIAITVYGLSNYSLAIATECSWICFAPMTPCRSSCAIPEEEERRGYDMRGFGGSGVWSPELFGAAREIRRAQDGAAPRNHPEYADRLEASADEALQRPDDAGADEQPV